MADLIGLDFETYAATDLRRHGLGRYIEDPTFTVLLASVAINNISHPTQKSAPQVHTIEFVNPGSDPVQTLAQALNGKTIVAHNASFEKAVLDRLGIHIPVSRYIDSAVISSAMGAGRALEAAASQLLPFNKMDEGRSLINLFCRPQKDQNSPNFQADLVLQHPQEWQQFIRYCERDAELALRLMVEFEQQLPHDELPFSQLTMEMNFTGWPVDVDLVRRMKAQYQLNMSLAEADFRQATGAHDLNLNSLPQLKQWCADRGVKATSFDEAHVASLLKKVEAKLSTMLTTHPRYTDYHQVRNMLMTKQTLGGSSLKKLDVILNTVEEDGRLRDQYVHCGASQTFRTSGRSVQMQNLKRLGQHVDDVDDLLDPTVDDTAKYAHFWTNERLAANLRQVFQAEHPQGALVVGDFSSVESRGLAWLAGEEWKLRAYRGGRDLYKDLASLIYSVPYSSVTKQQRQTGKVGELSCGYGAGPVAVQDFAAGMGVELSEGEATKLVADWREANPAIVELWRVLDEMLHSVMTTGRGFVHPLSDGFMLELVPAGTPESLQAQHPGSMSLAMEIKHSNTLWMRRLFHGCYLNGRNISYYKPSDRKTGDLWRSTYTHPKTKQVKTYDLYGGKLSGILTQSLCREIFMWCLTAVTSLLANNQVKVIGQFHDEIVLEYTPGPIPLENVKRDLRAAMSNPGMLKSFPLAAEVQSARRYIK